MNASLHPPPGITGPAPPIDFGQGADDEPAPIRHRTIWLSDIHLGTPGCKAEFLLDFLKHNDSDTLYLVGDILDGWRLKKGWHWPQAHNDVVQKILRKARKGTRVVYVQGEGGSYAPREIELGVQGELFTEVVKGLMPGEQVVTFGSFFIDADHKLKGL